MSCTNKLNGRKNSADNTAWALKKNKLVHISQVERGRACNCICAACKETVIARKGPKRAHHFSHLQNSKCQNAPESILHKLAKEIISNSDFINLPPYDYEIQREIAGQLINQKEQIAKGGAAKIDKVYLEREGKREGFIPDIVIQSNGKKLIIEICVTNPVNNRKLRKLRNNNEPTIEIKLDKIDAQRNLGELKYLILENTENKKWLYHPGQKNSRKNFTEKCREEIRRQRNKINTEVAVEPDVIGIRSWYQKTFRREPTMQEINEVRRKHKYKLSK